MKKLSLFLIAVFLLGFQSILNAEEDNTPRQKGERPKVGLVLSGGGAKGAAHIGVIKAIEEAGIPIDYITGTSMGSIMGGLYALGYTPDEMSSIIKTMDWSILMSNKVEQRSKSRFRKELDNKYILKIPFGKDVMEKREIYLNGRGNDEVVDKGFISSLPSGFINGNNVLNVLNTLAVGYQDSIDFNALPIPFACVSVDIVGSKEVHHHSGHLPSCIRASMAIPGVFSPVEMDGMVLVDGGFLNNFPVEVCKEMGADIIIGVEITKDIKETVEDSQSLPQVMKQIFRMITNSTTGQNREKVDILIRPDISGFGALSFSTENIDTLLSRGMKAGEKSLPELKALKEYLESYGPIEKKVPARRAINMFDTDLKISKINLNGLNARDEDFIFRKTGIKDLKTINGKQIGEAIGMMLGTGSFDKVTYNVVPTETPDVYELDFDYVLSRPHSINVAVMADTYEAVAVGVGAAFNQNRLNGFQAFVDAKLSMFPRLRGGISYAACPWPKINFTYEFSSFNSSEYDESMLYLDMSYNNRTSIQQRVNQQTAELFISEFYSKARKVKLGARWRHTFTKTALPYVTSDTGIWKEQYVGVIGQYTYDTRDSKIVPKKGIFVDLDLSYNFNLNNPNELVYWKYYSDPQPRDNDVQYGAIKGAFEAAIPCGDRFTIIPKLYGRVVLPTIGRYGDYKDVVLPYTGSYSMTHVGGVVYNRNFDNTIPFAGTYHYLPSFAEIAFAAVARLDAQVEVAKKHFLTATYNALGLSYGIGKNMFTYCLPDDYVVKALAGRRISNIYHGTALQYTYVSALGPVRLNVGWSNFVPKRCSVYLSLGYHF